MYVRSLKRRRYRVQRRRSAADRRLGLIDTLAALIPDHRDPGRVPHTMADILRARISAIACGCPDADDLHDLRKDPAFKPACGRLPERGDDLASGMGLENS
jgi:hypothetical protein